MKRLWLYLFLFSFLVSALFSFGEVTFKNLDLTTDDKLIVEAVAESPVFGNYTSLFLSDLKKKSINQITFFPERALFLRDRGVLQIQNRFGVFRSDESLKKIRAVSNFPSFTDGSAVLNGKINPISSSPDGRFLLYYSETSDAFGKLVMYDLRESKEIVISEKVELSLKGPDAIWSPDSKYVVYYKGGNLYYYSVDQYLESRVLAELYRRIGEGRIVNVKWGSENSLYYITGSLVYKLDSRELFTRALYSGFLKIGNITGKIPFRFDPNFDRFWISPDGKKIIFDKGGRNVFLYYLSNKDFLSIGSTQSLPYLYLPRNTEVKKLLWSKDDIITLLTVGIESGKKFVSLFRLDIGERKDDGKNRILAFQKTSDLDVTGIELSPDGRKIAILKKDSVLLKDYRKWKNINELKYLDPIHALWVDDYNLLICGRYLTSLYNLKEQSSSLITISQPQVSGFSKESLKPAVKVGEDYYTYDTKKLVWQKYGESGKKVADSPGGEKGEAGIPKAEGVKAGNGGDSAFFKNRSVVSTSYRAYLENVTMGSYRNMVMIRDIQGYGTKPLFHMAEIKYEPFPAKEEPVDFTNFTHGSRIRRREVALVFNAIDSSEGLADILKVLSEYGIKATFFVNGEFIRRYPDAVKEIAQSGHEVGSLFYIYFNMTDARFHLDEEFIKNGLAKTEDEYFEATGRDLSLLWHAPYYFVSSEIIAASREMNYTYVGRDVDSLDWVTKSERNVASGIYMSSSKLVERILKKKKPGSIIPIRIGVGKGERDDYLFQKLDILINGLMRRGYRVVSVTKLIEHAR